MPPYSAASGCRPVARSSKPRRVRNRNQPVMIAAAIITGWFLFRTRLGFELRATGLQPDAAEYGGIRVGSVWWRTLVLSGALAGIGGLNFVLGYKHYYEDAFASGAGSVSYTHLTLPTSDLV